MSRRNDAIKIIAMVTMAIDHIGVLLFPSLRILRTIGRIAFPIFAYQIAKGYSKTRNKKKYASRIAIFAVISQIPYMWLNQDMTMYLWYFNVLFLFLYSIGVLFLFDKTKEKRSLSTELNYEIQTRKDTILFILKKIGFFLALVIAIVLPQVMSQIYPEFALSYGTYGVLMILLFYICNDNWIKIFVSYIVLTVIMTYLNGVSMVSEYAIYFDFMNYTPASWFQTVFKFKDIWNYIVNLRDGLNTLEAYWFQARSIMALPIILVFTKLDINVKLNKWVGYLFYPGHITLLLIIRLIVGGPIA